MTRLEIKNLLEKYPDNPNKIDGIICSKRREVEEGFVILFYSPFPFRNYQEIIEIIKDIVYNDRKFYYRYDNETPLPKGAKYLCDIGECDAGMLYII